MQIETDELGEVINTDIVAYNAVQARLCAHKVM